MSTIVTINSSDQITNSRADLNTNFANLNSDKIETSVIDTDTTLAANSDAKIPSQKAVKAYVDVGGNVNASETTKGIVEEATDAEVTAGTATGGTGAKLFVTPAKLATRLSSIAVNVKANVTSRAGSTASGSQTIAHGLSGVPNIVLVHATAFDNTESICVSHGSYDGTTNSCVFSIPVEGGSSPAADLAGSSNANSIMLFDEGGSGGGNGQTATISVDATNITISWTKVSSGLSSTMYIHWVAMR